MVFLLWVNHIYDIFKVKDKYDIKSCIRTRLFISSWDRDLGHFHPCGSWVEYVARTQRTLNRCVYWVNKDGTQITDASSSQQFAFFCISPYPFPSSQSKIQDKLKFCLQKSGAPHNVHSQKTKLRGILSRKCFSFQVPMFHFLDPTLSASLIPLHSWSLNSLVLSFPIFHLEMQTSSSSNHLILL